MPCPGFKLARNLARALFRKILKKCPALDSAAQNLEKALFKKCPTMCDSWKTVIEMSFEKKISRHRIYLLSPSKFLGHLLNATDK